MPMRSRDIAFAASAGGLLLVLALNSFRAKPVAMPVSIDHRPFAAALAIGEKREVVEKGCLSCHNPTIRPLSSNHPPKKQCLICHALQQSN
ncbi:MAG: cytochrome C [Geobacteraceae bacterium]|nr:cytochrome C [Geobacteraceae bacterium]